MYELHKEINPLLLPSVCLLFFKPSGSTNAEMVAWWKSYHHVPLLGVHYFNSIVLNVPVGVASRWEQVARPCLYLSLSLIAFVTLPDSSHANSTLGSLVFTSTLQYGTFKIFLSYVLLTENSANALVDSFFRYQME